jgi:hypothetical protein
MKNSHLEKMVIDRLYEIAELNNFESDEIKQTIRSIEDKELILEFLVLFDFYVGFNDLNQMLNKISFYNRIQKKFKRIIETRNLN